MQENQVFEYSLSSGQNEQVLKMKMSKTHIILSVEYNNGKLFTAYVNAQQLKGVCKAFIRTKTLKEIVMILHNTIESGNISLTEDEKGLSIELIFSIKLASGNYPPFSIILELEERNSLKGKKAVNNKEVAKNGKSMKNSTEYNKPIVEPNYKKPIVQLEYIEPILQVHYPDGTTKSTTLPARIQTVDGKIPNIDEAQFKLIQQEMNKHMANQDKEGADKSKYSINTQPSPKSRNEAIKTETYDGNEGEEKSKYSTFSVSAKPIVYPEQKYDKNNQYSNYSQNNKIIEYAPNMINQNQYQDNDSYQFVQQEVDFNQLIGQNNSNNYNNYSNYTNDNYSNYYNYQSGNQYQTGYYTQNSYDLNQLFQNQNQNQYQYQNYDYQPQNYQYQNNIYSSSYPQTFSNQFEQAFAEVIPLNPIQEFLQSQNAKAQEQENKKVESPPQGNDKDKKDEKNQKGEEKEEENEEEEEGEEYEEEEDDENEEGNENQNNEEGNENQNNEEGNENQNNEEVNENQNNEEVNENQNNEEGEEAQKESEQENTEDFETLYRTEEGLIIYRNGILKGIIDKYSEIDNVVTKIQIIISKGAKFNLLYKATLHGDKASVFHEKCDNHQMTLVLVETTKNVRFGGFTTETWDGHCIKKTDNNAFVFSIDKNKIYGIIPNQPAIGCYPKYGPVFFGCQIRIYNDFFTKGGTTCLSELNYNTTQDYELNNGEQKYIVKDIEVYDIEGIDI